MIKDVFCTLCNMKAEKYTQMFYQLLKSFQINIKGSLCDWSTEELQSAISIIIQLMIYLFVTAIANKAKGLSKDFNFSLTSFVRC